MRDVFVEAVLTDDECAPVVADGGFAIRDGLRCLWASLSATLGVRGRTYRACTRQIAVVQVIGDCRR